MINIRPATEDPKTTTIEEEEEIIPAPVYTYEDWKRLMKTNHCLICDKVGHYKDDCKWTTACPTYAALSPFAEMVCWCCGQAPEINHPNVPLLDIPLRAQIK
ncbi:hypothetical protein AQUCO_03100013v1 [Aquilegia coerulea]|uniref:CCHC-type domain-containing protein n=1 Tax=Aquilegia coerulea TaxID=218851 RepID=A0A2G5D0D5_AQUCA|nr:hypothetical protein AQUCO_03100013v1 [Aquilegia coerulea]